MELGFALALGLEVPGLIRQAVGSVPLVDYSTVCMLGPRDKKILQKTKTRSLDDGGIEYHDDVSLRRGNIRAMTRRVTRRLAGKAEGLWLHVDLDVLSTRSLPAVDYQQSGGLSWSRLQELTSAILSSGDVLGMNMTIYNPDLDPDMRSAKSIVRYLQTALASTR